MIQQTTLPCRFERSSQLWTTLINKGYVKLPLCDRQIGVPTARERQIEYSGKSTASRVTVTVDDTSMMGQTFNSGSLKFDHCPKNH
jgi:hypothetical protein